MIIDVINLKRQHNEVMSLANYISDNIKNSTVNQNLKEIAINFMGLGKTSIVKHIKTRRINHGKCNVLLSV